MIDPMSPSVTVMNRVEFLTGQSRGRQRSEIHRRMGRDVRASETKGQVLLNMPIGLVFVVGMVLGMLVI